MLLLDSFKSHTLRNYCITTTNMIAYTEDRARKISMSTATSTRATRIITMTSTVDQVQNRWGARGTFSGTVTGSSDFEVSSLFHLNFSGSKSGGQDP